MLRVWYLNNNLLLYDFIRHRQLNLMKRGYPNRWIRVWHPDSWWFNNFSRFCSFWANILNYVQVLPNQL